jgi:hypothetical protein
VVGHGYFLLPLLRHLCRLHRNSGAIVALLHRLYRNSGATVVIAAQAVQVGGDNPIMAGTITALKLQKKNKERVNVYLDGRYAFSLAAIEAAKLKRGQLLSDQEIEGLLGRDSFQKAYGRALRFLS